MFENYRGIEYGWESGSEFNGAIARTHIFDIILGLTRADTNEQWKREAIAALNKASPGWRFGTPMDHGMEEVHSWRKLLRLTFQAGIKAGYPTGAHTTATILDRDTELFNVNKGDGRLWSPPINYRTSIGSVTRVRFGLKKLSLMLEILDDLSVKPDELSPDELETMLGGKHQGIHMFLPRGWLPLSQEPERKEATEYDRICKELQASPAGKKAKRLLLENLSEPQTETYFRHGHFFCTPSQDGPLEDRRIYVVERGYPNGNIRQVKLKRSRAGQWFWYPTKTYCYQTAEPHAIDDILLAQKLLIEHEEDYFLKEANVFPAPYDGRVPLHKAQFSV